MVSNASKVGYSRDMVELYIDADSCPKPLRAIVLKATVNRNLKAFFVADRPLKDVQQAYEEHTALLRSDVDQEDERRMIKSPITMTPVWKIKWKLAQILFPDPNIRWIVET